MNPLPPSNAFCVPDGPAVSSLPIGSADFDDPSTAGLPVFLEDEPLEIGDEDESDEEEDDAFGDDLASAVH